MKISWVAIVDPDNRFDRLSTWYGPSETVVVTGVPDDTWRNCALTFTAPDTAVVHQIPDGANRYDFARALGGALVSGFKGELIQ